MLKKPVPLEDLLNTKVTLVICWLSLRVLRVLATANCCCIHSSMISWCLRFKPLFGAIQLLVWEALMFSTFTKLRSTRDENHIDNETETEWNIVTMDIVERQVDGFSGHHEHCTYVHLSPWGYLVCKYTLYKFKSRWTSTNNAKHHD